MVSSANLLCNKVEVCQKAESGDAIQA